MELYDVIELDTNQVLYHGLPYHEALGRSIEADLVGFRSDLVLISDDWDCPAEKYTIILRIKK